MTQVKNSYWNKRPWIETRVYKEFFTAEQVTVHRYKPSGASNI